MTDNGPCNCEQAIQLKAERDECLKMLRELEEETLCWNSEANYKLSDFKDVYDRLCALLSRIED